MTEKTYPEGTLIVRDAVAVTNIGADDLVEVHLIDGRLVARQTGTTHQTLKVTGEAEDLLLSFLEHRHPSVAGVGRYLTYRHLPEHLQEVSGLFTVLAYQLLSEVSDDSPELTVALRKLLEAKDCAVRARVDETRALTLETDKRNGATEPRLISPGDAAAAMGLPDDVEDAGE